MEILEIRMKHFGRFAGQGMTFHPGVNIIYGENETGKSTMHAFIRGMLYGIARQRGRAARMDEYMLRKPWDGGGFGGVLRFESGGKRYYLERNFEQREKWERLICEDDGREVPLEDGLPKELLDGMDERMFANTVCIGQESARTDEGLAIAIRNFMANVQSQGTQEVDVKAALKELQEERRKLEKKKKQRLTERVERAQEMRMRLDAAVQELEELQEEEQGYQEMLTRTKARVQEERNAAAWQQEQKRRRAGGFMAGKIALTVFAVIALAAALISKEQQVRLFGCALIALACLGVWGLGCLEKRQSKKCESKRSYLPVWQEQELAYREKKQKEPQYGTWQQEEEREKAEEACQRQRIKLEWVQNAISEKQRTLEELKEQYEEAQAQTQEDEEIGENLSAVYLAIDTLKEVTAEIYGKYAQRLNGRVSEILSQITGERYTKVFLDESLEVKLYAPQGILDIGQVSRGTMEQVYFALRMAAAEVLHPQEAMPVLLDDAFAMYDDTRLEHTLKWLCSCGHQVLLFTCQKREQELLQKICGE